VATGLKADTENLVIFLGWLIESGRLPRRLIEPRVGYGYCSIDLSMRHTQQFNAGVFFERIAERV